MGLPISPQDTCLFCYCNISYVDNECDTRTCVVDIHDKAHFEYAGFHSLPTYDNERACFKFYCFFVLFLNFQLFHVFNFFV